MMDHSHEHAAVDGPSIGGWLVALVAGAVAMGLARWMGDVGLAASLALGALNFGVFGVLLGAGGVELVAGHGDHGDGAHDHSHDHGHGHGHH